VLGIPKRDLIYQGENETWGPQDAYDAVSDALSLRAEGGPVVVYQYNDRSQSFKEVAAALRAEWTVG
jgi:hypothetical protein